MNKSTKTSYSSSPENDTKDEILRILFRSRWSNAVQQDVYIECEVCERKLDEEYFAKTDRERLLDEQDAILEALTDLIDEKVKEARIDEVYKFKLNRSHNKGELELINARINELKRTSVVD